MFQTHRPKVKDELAEMAQCHPQRLLKLVKNINVFGTVKPNAKLLNAQIGCRENLDGVVVDACGDTTPLLLLSPDNVVKQSTAVEVGRLVGIEAQLQDKLGSLCFS